MFIRFGNKIVPGNRTLVQTKQYKTQFFQYCKLALNELPRGHDSHCLFDDNSFLAAAKYHLIFMPSHSLIGKLNYELILDNEHIKWLKDCYPNNLLTCPVHERVAYRIKLEIYCIENGCIIAQAVAVEKYKIIDLKEKRHSTAYAKLDMNSRVKL